LIVAEGYMDVIALARAGFDHACAPLGTALTPDQLTLLWRAGPEPVLCFDGDKAGLRAAFRSIERALPLLQPGKTVRFALMPDGKDPDDLIRDSGARAMAEVIDKAIPLVDMLWRREIEREDLSTPEARAGLKDRIYAVLREIEHSGVREQYKTALLKRFDKAYGAPAFKPNSYSKGSWGRKKGNPPPTSALKAKMDKYRSANLDRGPAEKRLVGTILSYPALLRSVDEIFFELELDTPLLSKLQMCIMEYWRDAIAVDKHAIRAHIESQGLGQALKLFTTFGKDVSAIAIAAEGSDLKTVENEWLREAGIHQELDVAKEQRAEFRDRMNVVLRANDREAMLKLMRATSAAKRQTAARTE
jgi:DNA primase